VACEAPRSRESSGRVCVEEFISQNVILSDISPKAREACMANWSRRTLRFLYAERSTCAAYTPL